MCEVLGVPAGEPELCELEGFDGVHGLTSFALAASLLPRPLAEPRPSVPTPCVPVKVEERPVMPLIAMVAAIFVAVLACAVWLLRSA